MGSLKYGAYLSGLSIPALGSTETGAIDEALHDPHRDPKPLQQRIPISEPSYASLGLQSTAFNPCSQFTIAQLSQPDLQSVDTNQNSSKPDTMWPSSGPFLSNGQLQQLQKQSWAFWGFTPSYCDVDTNLPLPPDMPNDCRSPDSRLDQNAYQASEQHNRFLAQLAFPTSDLETTLPLCPRKRVKITEPQSETDEKSEPEQNCSIGNKNCQPGRGLTNPLLSPDLEIALKKLFPESHSFGDCMENLIYAYQKYSRRPSRDHRVDVSGVDKSGHAGWVQAGCTNTGTKSFPTTFPSVSCDANSETDFDGENESAGHEEDASDSENNSKPISTTAVDQTIYVTNVSIGAISSEHEARLLPLNPDPRSPAANQQHSNDKGTARRFACPFYQRNPEKHQDHRSCEGPGWEAVRRVKYVLFLLASGAS
jgi:hypothetical protein